MMTQHPNAVLRGGGSLVPDGERIRHVSNTTDTFKLFLGNRYEHYAPTEDMYLHDDGQELQVFEWVRRTFVAE
ncbi:DUF5988 family protein [Streptomyces sp. NPDC056161]|uniref:DUF5988 family protein n=1 Tax=Streptomyces sp. NPDC056161 TaxID=3345732 RepID=UPI0035E03DB5